jgi:hypothetical protein
MICDIKKGSIYFKGNENFTINGLHAPSSSAPNSDIYLYIAISN